MNERTSSWFSIAALLIGAAALALAFVAVFRAADTTAPSDAVSETGGHGAHGAPAVSEGVPDATVVRGGTVLKPRIVDGVWEYELTAAPVRWPILDDARLTAYAYNGMVPGPQLRVPYGQRVRVVVRNELPDPTTVHWHGIAVPNSMDGVPDVTQEPIESGASFTYEFRAIPTGRDSRGGTFMYHSHFQEDRQVGLGLTGTFVITEPRSTAYDIERTIVIGEWTLDAATGETRPSMEFEGSFPNFFTLNGKSYPSTETIEVERGDRVLLRLVGAGQFEHPMHLHGTNFRIVAKDGYPVATPQAADVVQVAPGERYDIAFTATEPGKWLFHCHIGHHLTNDGADPGGLILVVDVAA